LSSSAAISRDANAFVGASSSNILSAGTTGLMGGTRGMSGMGMLGSMGYGGMGGLGRSGMFGMQGMNSMGRTSATGGRTGTAQLRIPMRLGLDLSPPRTATVSARMSQFESRLPRLRGLGSTSSVVVKLDAGTALIEGTVAGERERDLIGRLALLEPGVKAVQNALKVDPSLAQPGTMPNLESVPATAPR
jgi:hypothetical protein